MSQLSPEQRAGIIARLQRIEQESLELLIICEVPVVREQLEMVQRQLKELSQ